MGHEECSAGYEVTITSDGTVGYRQIEHAFQTNVIGGYARAIMNNPLHLDLPAMVIVLHPT